MYDADIKKKSRHDDSSEGSDSNLHIPTSIHPSQHPSMKDDGWPNIEAGLEVDSEYPLMEGTDGSACIQGKSINIRKPMSQKISDD